MNTLDSIIKYILFLENEYSLYVSIHCFKPPLNALMPLLGKYNTHYHPYCLYIKSHPELWKICLTMQAKTLNKSNDNIFFEECCFGVCEYVVPIRHEEKTVGFISVSGFISNKQSFKSNIKKLCSEHNLDYSELYNSSKSLSKNPPNEKFIIATIQHIADALSMYSYILPQNDGNNKTNYIYSNALAYIHEHYTEQITVDDIAKFCNCSRSYITKLFKANGDFCIKTYITFLRMQEAKKLLKNSDKSIKEISFYLGYNDSNYFSNAFYKNVGRYPREYRRSKFNLLKDSD